MTVVQEQGASGAPEGPVAESAAALTTAERYRYFADHESAGIAPIYARLGAGIAEDPDVLAFLDELPRRCRQPNLLLAVVRFGFGLQESYADFRAIVLERGEEVRRLLLERTTQTNEAARCAAVLPILASLPQPLALLEVGASAGLCLLPDRYGYRYGDALLEGTGPVFAPRLVGPNVPPVPAAHPAVVWRRGIDLAPLDVRDGDAVRWLESLVWPGQSDRAERLRAAVAVAREDPPTVIAGDLRTSVLEEVAAQAPAGATLVILHSAALEYVPVDARVEFAQRVDALGAAWIASEPPGTVADAPWPGGATDRKHFVVSVGGTLRADGPVARMCPHGDWLEWGATGFGS